MRSGEAEDPQKVADGFAVSVTHPAIMHPS
jgi:hypothetical protein